ncbi:MAG: aminotransferase class I/II-fold pyridoxal phosphate-dependent enzyme, partial [Nitrospirae bacterium]|nr:aminotransferase class I/II-fold pyridoxal phosphate-dependent enzyme [Nitrospirota bacterium]
MNSPITYARQGISDDDIDEVVKILRSDIITRGKKTEEFEKSLAGYCGARYAVVFNSGTSALHGAYFAAGLGKGDEFITSPMTFAATANAGLFLGARPVFADVESDTGNADFQSVYEAITDKTRLIVPVLFAGHPVESERLFSLAAERELVVVEDACHALGASYERRHFSGGEVAGKFAGKF